MSDWPTINASVNAVMIATFGVPAIFTPQDGAGSWLAPQTILGIVMRPAMPEDVPPGYLTTLQRHSAELKQNPSEWVPWNYRDTLARLATPVAA